MTRCHNDQNRITYTLQERVLTMMLVLLLMLPPIPARAEEPQQPDSVLDVQLMVPVTLQQGTPLNPVDTLYTAGADSILNVVQEEGYTLSGKRIFNPDPTRAVWLSALLPGLGQIYNRRYWKIPIIIGGFMGLGYATNWNNNQYQDYTQGYRDLLDNDPNTNSYMNFFPPTTNEGDLDKTWLQSTLKSRKDYYRRNRDLCIICIAALYLLCMVDAYVDASLAHFDVTPTVSMDVAPALMIEPSTRRTALGLNWAINF